MYSLEKLHNNLGCFAYYLLLFGHLWPANQPAITGVVRCHEKFYDLWHIFIVCWPQLCST